MIGDSRCSSRLRGALVEFCHEVHASSTMLDVLLVREIMLSGLREELRVATDVTGSADPVDKDDLVGENVRSWATLLDFIMPALRKFVESIQRDPGRRSKDTLQ